MAPTAPLKFADLRRDVDEIRSRIDQRIAGVLQRGSFILGVETAAFEQEFAKWLGIPRVVGVGSGTDAIALALGALGIVAGDEVVTVANTCAPTALAIAITGAQLRFVDCDPDTLMMSIRSLERVVTRATRAIVPVHLYGSGADMRAVLRIARAVGAVVVEDCAHAVGTKLYGRAAGTFGDASAFSFYPTKNLGAYGDGGAVATEDARVADRAVALRHHGQRERDLSEYRGRNSRLDEIQAAVLRAKLQVLDDWNARRRTVAAFYEERFRNAGIRMPARPEYVGQHAYHLFPILVPERDRFREALSERGVETLVHYPVPLHLQPAFAELGCKRGDFPASEAACASIVSIPLYPQLTDAEVQRVATEVIAAFA